MKVLVVTACVAAMRRLIFEGWEHSAGLPSQEYVLRGMVKSGWTVDMIVSGANLENEINIKADWLNEINQITFVKRGDSILQKILFMFKIRHAVKRALKQGKYDFVYFQGADGSPAISVATKKGIACGQRLFGTGHMIRALDPYGRFFVFLRYFPQYCAFVTRKEFLIITNDGSKPKEVCERLCGSRLPYRLEVWNNGVQYDQGSLLQTYRNPSPSKPYIFYGARVTLYKRQDRAIEVLHQLKEMGVDMDLVFAGDIEDRAYFQELLDLAQRYHLLDNIKFLGNIPSSLLASYRVFAQANLFMAQGTNRGNSLIEAMAIGSIVIVLDDRSCNDFVEHYESGVLVQTCEDAVQAIVKIANDPRLAERLRAQSVRSCLTQFPSWDIRVQKELDYIEDCVKRKRGNEHE